MQWSSWWQKGIGTGAGAQSSHLIHKQRERETHAGNGVRFYFYLFVCLLLAFRDRFSLCSNPNYTVLEIALVEQAGLKKVGLHLSLLAEYWD